MCISFDTDWKAQPILDYLIFIQIKIHSLSTDRAIVLVLKGAEPQEVLVILGKWWVKTETFTPFPLETGNRERASLHQSKSKLEPKPNL